MCDPQELTERFRRVLQRNAVVPHPAAEVAPGERYKDAYGHRVTVINSVGGRVQFRRDGYGKPCELSQEKFLKKFTKVES